MSDSRQFRPPGSLIPLVLTAVAMELLYVWILRLNNLKEHVETFILLVLLQGILYFVSIYFAEKISPRVSHLVLIFVAAAAFRLTLFPLYPSLSDDLVRYRWEGMAQDAGLNPYKVTPANPELGYLRNDTYPAVAGSQYSTIYGPLLEQVLWASYKIFHGVVAMKLPFILLDLGVVLALFRLLPLLGISPMRALVYAWSPLTAVEFSASGHNDPLSILGVVLALLFYYRAQHRLSIGALTAAALSKVYAVFLFPVLLARQPMKRWLHVLWIPPVLAAIAFAPYGQAWGDLLRSLSQYGAHWRNNSSLYHAVLWTARTDARAAKLYLAVVAAAILYCIVRKFAPERACYIVLGTMLLFSPNVFPWYITWIVPFLAIYPNPAWLFLTMAAPLSYHVLIPYRTLGLWQETPLFAWLEYTPFFALLIGSYAYTRYRAATGREQSRAN
ncbi:MAG: hypothetical protein HYX72_03455 [Acidobacteria bacterium]|nr:hypothetical protein [Acidobacteriota bacterium]